MLANLDAGSARSGRRLDAHLARARLSAAVTRERSQTVPPEQLEPRDDDRRSAEDDPQRRARQLHPRRDAHEPRVDGLKVVLDDGEVRAGLTTWWSVKRCSSMRNVVAEDGYSIITIANFSVVAARASRSFAVAAAAEPFQPSAKCS